MVVVYFTWLGFLTVTYLMQQENKAGLSYSTLGQILNYIKSHQITKYFGIQVFAVPVKGRFPQSPPFPKRNMKRDPPEIIFYSVHIALLNIFPKQGACASFSPFYTKSIYLYRVFLRNCQKLFAYYNEFPNSGVVDIQVY